MKRCWLFFIKLFSIFRKNTLAHPARELSASPEFLSLISHELRTPMNGILGSLHVLDRKGLQEEQIFCLQQVKASAHEVMYLMMELLDYSAIQAGAIQVQESAFNLRDSLLVFFKKVEIKCAQKKIKFNESISFDVPHYLLMDGKKFMTMLDHLLDNAWKYTQQGSIDCFVSVDEKNQLRIQVSDTGIGISPQHREEMFKPFKQEESYAKRSIGGLGLGLSICDAFAEVLQGEIKYLIAPSRGSHFLLTLPMRLMQYGEVVQLENSKFNAQIIDSPASKLNSLPESFILAPRKTSKKRASIKVLIVDDNATNCFVAKGIVKKLGYQSETVFSGRSALALLNEHEFDLVLMDCQMPEMDGFQAALALRQLEHLNKDIPIIAVTANALPSDRQMCLDNGMNDYMTKPISLELLEEKISYWLSLSEQEIAADETKEKTNKVIGLIKHKK